MNKEPAESVASSLQGACPPAEAGKLRSLVDIAADVGLAAVGFVARLARLEAVVTEAGVVGLACAAQIAWLCSTQAHPPRLHPCSACN